MKQKLYDLKIKVLKSKIKANEKLEIVEQIFQIETDLAINYTRCSTQLKTIFKVGDNVIYRGVISAKVIDVLEHNFYKIEDGTNDIKKVYTSSLELQ